MCVYLFILQIKDAQMVDHENLKLTTEIKIKQRYLLTNKFIK